MEPKETYLIVWYDEVAGDQCTELLLATKEQVQQVVDKLGSDIHTLLPLLPDYTDSNNVDWNPEVFDGTEVLKVKELPVFDLEKLNG